MRMDRMSHFHNELIYFIFLYFYIKYRCSYYIDKQSSYMAHLWKYNIFDILQTYYNLNFENRNTVVLSINTEGIEISCTQKYKTMFIEV